MIRHETVTAHWVPVLLERQIGALGYERLLASVRQGLLASLRLIPGFQKNQAPEAIVFFSMGHRASNSCQNRCDGPVHLKRGMQLSLFVLTAHQTYLDL